MTNQQVPATIAFVKAWNMPPDGAPKECAYYFYDRGKGWTYLTPRGEAFYRQHKDLVDPLLAQFRKDVESWATEQVEKLLQEEEA